MTPDITILKLQIIATTFMGADYFIPNKYRDIANEYVNDYFSGVQNRIDNNINLGIEHIKKNYKYLLTGALYLFFVYVVNITKNKLYKNGTIDNTAFEILMLATLPFMVIGYLRIFKIMMDVFIPVGIASILRSITTFVTKSPKGPIAAIGMIFLMLSFYLRYRNITTIGL